MKWYGFECFVLPAEGSFLPFFLLKDAVALKIMIVLVVVLAHNSEKIRRVG